MYRSRGLYVFSNGNTMRRIIFDGKEAKELPEISYEQQLIHFLELDLNPFGKTFDRLQSRSKENTNYEELLKLCRTVGWIAENFCVNEPVYSFLLCTQLYVNSWNVTGFDELFYVKDQAIEVLRRMLYVQDFFFTLADAYCRFEGTHTEKFNHLSLGRGRIFDLRLDEVISHTRVDTDMFYMSVHKTLPYNRGYRFENLSDYIWFVFLQTMEYDIGFSKCDYCGHFFIPKTKKKTLYCDRVRTEDGRTCKQIGPAQIYKARIKYSDLLADYDRAINRNYRRVERYELKPDEEKCGKDMTYNEYATWLKLLHEAKVEFLSGKMSLERFTEIIHMID